MRKNARVVRSTEVKPGDLVSQYCAFEPYSDCDCDPDHDICECGEDAYCLQLVLSTGCIDSEMTRFIGEKVTYVNTRNVWNNGQCHGTCNVIGSGNFDCDPPHAVVIARGLDRDTKIL